MVTSGQVSRLRGNRSLQSGCWHTPVRTQLLMPPGDGGLRRSLGHAPSARADVGADSLAVGVAKVSEEQLIEPSQKVSGFALIGGFVGGEQDEPQRSLSGPNGCQFELHLVIGSARPQRRLYESIRG